MRWIFGLLSVVVVLTLLVPILTRLQHTLEVAPVAPQIAETKTPASAGKEKGETRTVTELVEVYRWVDSKGTIHYSTSPPPAGTKVEVVTMKKKVEVASGPESRTQSIGKTASKQSKVTSLADSPFSVYTRDGQEELMQRLDETVEVLREHQSVTQQLEKDL